MPTSAPTAALADIGVSPRSAAGHYTLQVLANDSDRYEVVAQATGAQARDARCRLLRLTMDSGHGHVQLRREHRPAQFAGGESPLLESLMVRP